MRKMLVIGLGGSGGKTLQFLMADLLEQLRALGWTGSTLPASWQFVHIDVPTKPDGVADDLPPTVPDLGGSYVGIARTGDRYSTLYDAVATGLRNAPGGSLFGQVARVLPQREAANVIPILLGAGQFRAVGRVATVARGSAIFAGLQDAVQRLGSAQSDAHLSTIRELAQAAAGAPLLHDDGTSVFIVSSLAGGSGASMVLDVANLIHGMPGNMQQSIAFLYTADVFSRLSGVSGVNANSLAAISELLGAAAAGERPWTTEEWAVYNTGTGAPAQATFRGPSAIVPIGAVVNGMRISDDPHVIYRGFARALSQQFVDQALRNDFEAHTLTNLYAASVSMADNAELVTDPYTGERGPILFTSIGYASILMGSDRFAAYASQAMARRTVDRLLRGHLDVSGELTDEAARQREITRLTPQFLRWSEFDVPAGPEGDQRLVFGLWPLESQRSFAYDQAKTTTPPGSRFEAPKFSSMLKQNVRNLLTPLDNDTDGRLAQSAEDWIVAAQGRIEKAYVRVAASSSLHVANGVLEAFGHQLSALASRLDAAARNVVPWESVESAGEQATRGAGGGVLDAGHRAVVDALNNVRSGIAQRVFGKTAERAAELIRELGVNVVTPLLKAGVVAVRDLSVHDEIEAPNGVIAGLEPDIVKAWPEDGHVPARFAPPANEILVRPIEEYPSTLASILGAQHHPANGAQAVAAGVSEILTASRIEDDRLVPLLYLDPAYAGEVSGPWFLGRTSSWRRTPDPEPAGYRFVVDPRALRLAARAWVTRRQNGFEGLLTQGIAAYLAEPSLAPRDLEARATAFGAKLNLALNLAHPFVDVDETTVIAALGETDANDGPNLGVDFSVGGLPVVHGSATGERVLAEIASQSATTQQRVQAAMGAADRQGLSIVGRFAKPYLPMAYSSLARPVRDGWASAASRPVLDPEVHPRGGSFWQWRRARPLREFLPVSPSWQQAFYSGWLLGSITGHLVSEVDARNRRNYRVTRAGMQAEWIAFPDVLLGEVRLGKVKTREGTEHLDESDWNAAAEILETLPLAIMSCQGNDMSPLRPYNVLKNLGTLLVHRYAPEDQVTPLAAWIQTGNGPDGARYGMTPELAAAETPDDRISALRSSLTTFRAAFAERYLPLGRFGASGNGRFANITQENFEHIPREYEAVNEILTAVADVLTELDDPSIRGER